jgi:2-(1,2-epoxy-1,2-dihydrophenyl)acetyl-CoA isomerase
LLEIQDRKAVRTIVLNRPDKGNGLSRDLAHAIVEALDRACRDEQIRIIAITGTGGVFSLGLDRSMSSDIASGVPRKRRWYEYPWAHELMSSIRWRCGKIIVGGVNGPAIGGGLGLAMATDVRLISRSARLEAGFAPRLVGTSDTAATTFLPPGAGYERAIQAFSGRPSLSAEDALTLGLAGEIIDDQVFSAGLEASCEELSAWHPTVLGLTKFGLIRARENADIDTEVRIEAAIYKSLSPIRQKTRPGPIADRTSDLAENG